MNHNLDRRSFLFRGAGIALVAGLAACGRGPAPANDVAQPAPANDVAQSAPANSTGESGPTAPPMMPMDENMMAVGAAPDEAGGPRERFIVCPGNPRCPPAGNRPRNRPD